MKTKKTECLEAIEKVKFLNTEWKDLDFVILTKNQLLKIALELHIEIEKRIILCKDKI